MTFDYFLLGVEWLGAAALGLSILWYPARGGWRRLGAPLAGVFGCLGFLAVGMYHGIFGVAALNGSMVFVNGYNLIQAVRMRRRVRAETARIREGDHPVGFIGVRHSPGCSCQAREERR